MTKHCKKSSLSQYKRKAFSIHLLSSASIIFFSSSSGAPNDRMEPNTPEVPQMSPSFNKTNCSLDSLDPKNFYAVPLMPKTVCRHCFPYLSGLIVEKTAFEPPFLLLGIHSCCASSPVVSVISTVSAASAIVTTSLLYMLKHIRGKNNITFFKL